MMTASQRIPFLKYIDNNIFSNVEPIYTVLWEENKCNIIKKQLQNYQNGHLWKLKINIQYLENIWKLDSENTY